MEKGPLYTVLDFLRIESRLGTTRAVMYSPDRHPGSSSASAQQNLKDVRRSLEERKVFFRDLVREAVIRVHVEAPLTPEEQVLLKMVVDEFAENC